MNAKEAVLARYPDAMIEPPLTLRGRWQVLAISTGKYPFMRQIGRADTPDDAWIDAMNKLPKEGAA